MNERLSAERQRDVEGAADLAAEEFGRRDAHDGEGDLFERQRPADGVGSAAETPLPERVADDRHRAVIPAATPIVVRRQRSTEDRRDAQRLEVRAVAAQAAAGGGSDSGSSVNLGGGCGGTRRPGGL